MQLSVAEAYRMGQEHMRNRIARQWAGWITHTIGGIHRATRPSRKGRNKGDVSLQIRSMRTEEWRDIPVEEK